MPNNEKGYFKQVIGELKNVKWPTKATMMKYTLAVIIFIIIFGIYFYGLDAIFSWFRGLFN